MSKFNKFNEFCNYSSNITIKNPKLRKRLFLQVLFYFA